MKNNAPEMATSLLERQAQWLNDYQPGVRISERGSVVSVGDGIVWIKGLPSAAMDDILTFADGSRAMVFDLTRELIGAILLHQTDALTAGTSVQRSGMTLSVPVGDVLLGRIIDPLGTPLDDTSLTAYTRLQALESTSPPITARDFVHEPLYTGIKIIDTLIPIGKGQRQLLIGDEGLGRSSIALDTVINQRGQDIYCVYVLIGQKRSTVVSTIDTLREYGALDYTTVVVAEASEVLGDGGSVVAPGGAVVDVAVDCRHAAAGEHTRRMDGGDGAVLVGGGSAACGAGGSGLAGVGIGDRVVGVRPVEVDRIAVDEPQQLGIDDHTGQKRIQVASQQQFFRATQQPLRLRIRRLDAAAR